MIKSRVDHLDAGALADAIEDAAREAALAAGEAIVASHRDAIRSGRSPLGGQQKRNIASTSRAKGGREALHDTGRLLHGTAARVVGDRVEVTPPSDRRQVVEHLHDLGYVTVFAGDAADFEDLVEDEVERAANAVDVGRHVTREVIE